MSSGEYHHGLSCFCDACITRDMGSAKHLPLTAKADVELQRLNKKMLDDTHAAHMAAVQAINNPSMGAVFSPPGTVFTQGAVSGSGAAALNRASDARMSLGLPGVTLFAGMVEVSKVENGYLVALSTELGGLPRLFIASTVAEANSIILSQMVAFRLES